MDSTAASTVASPAGAGDWESSEADSSGDRGESSSAVGLLAARSLQERTNQPNNSSAATREQAAKAITSPIWRDRWVCALCQAGLGGPASRGSSASVGCSASTPPASV